MIFASDAPSVCRKLRTLPFHTMGRHLLAPNANLLLLLAKEVIPGLLLCPKQRNHGALTAGKKIEKSRRLRFKESPLNWKKRTGRDRSLSSKRLRASLLNQESLTSKIFSIQWQEKRR
jgi:hypothetical protein